MQECDSVLLLRWDQLSRALQHAQIQLAHASGIASEVQLHNALRLRVQQLSQELEKARAAIDAARGRHPA